MIRTCTRWWTRRWLTGSTSIGDTSRARRSDPAEPRKRDSKMLISKRIVAGVVMVLTLAAADAASAQQQRREQSQAGVYKSRITPHWFGENARLWYRNDLRGGGKEFVVVDASAGVRRLAFDHARLGASLSKAAGSVYAAERLPFDEIEFVDDARVVQFKVGDITWRCGLESYECVRTDAPARGEQRRPEGDERTGGRG